MSDENPFEHLSDSELMDRLGVSWNSVLNLRAQIKKAKEALPAASEELEQLEREASKRKRRDEWLAKQPEFERARQDPEWQAWRVAFLARARAAEINTLNLPTPGLNFVHEDVSLTDLNLFMAPIHPEEEFVRFDNSWTMAQVVVHVGLFQSLTQARKNGFNKPIPSGFSQHVMGKKKTTVFILNRLPKEPKPTRSMSWVYQGVSYTYGNGFYTCTYPDGIWSVSFNGVHFVNGKVVRSKRNS